MDVTLRLFLPLLVLAQLCRCQQPKINYREKEKQVLDQILGPASYDAIIRPSGVNGSEGPTEIKVNMFVRSMWNIDEIKMEYSTQLTFRQQWQDERLKFSDYEGKIKYLTLIETDRVWTPDLFFSNEKEGHLHDILEPNVYFRIFPDGSVLYSSRISLKLSCPMDLRLFPFDKQECQIRIASYGWTTDDLVLLWKVGDPVQIVKNLYFPRFTLNMFRYDYCNSKTNTGEYSCLKVIFSFKRELSFYLMQMYLPCCMLVLVSWVSLWLDESAVTARALLSSVSLLTMVTHISGFNNYVPSTSFTKPLDVWTSVCLTFAIGAIVELVVVNLVSRSDMHRDNLQKQRQAQSELEHSVQLESDLIEDGGTTFAMKPAVKMPAKCDLQAPPNPNCLRSWLSKFPTRSKRIDVISRITFPLVFAFFNIIYWSNYLFREDADVPPHSIKYGYSWF